MVDRPLAREVSMAYRCEMDLSPGTCTVPWIARAGETLSIIVNSYCNDSRRERCGIVVNQQIMMNRRAWMAGTAALAASGVSASPNQSGGGKKPVSISSANGLAACAKAFEMMSTGADTLDAVIAGVNIVELDPNDTSVG